MSTSRRPAKANLRVRQLPPALGWREWASLPELGIPAIKVKIDSGARTSALHATDIEYYKSRGHLYVKFKVHPIQRKSKPFLECKARVKEFRHVISSVGHSTQRPVIETNLTLGGVTSEIELTLINRDVMGFRMLVGRQAIRGAFLIDPGHSYYFGRVTERQMRQQIRELKP